MPITVPWVGSSRQTIWLVMGGSNPGDAARVKEDYGQVDTDGYLRSIGSLRPIGGGAIPWGSNFSGIEPFKTEREACARAVELLTPAVAKLQERLTEYQAKAAVLDQSETDQT